jgi:hypothetical protein
MLSVPVSTIKPSIILWTPDNSQKVSKFLWEALETNEFNKLRANQEFLMLMKRNRLNPAKVNISVHKAFEQFTIDGINKTLVLPCKDDELREIYYGIFSRIQEFEKAEQKVEIASEEKGNKKITDRKKKIHKLKKSSSFSENDETNDKVNSFKKKFSNTNFSNKHFSSKENASSNKKFTKADRPFNKRPFKKDPFLPDLYEKKLIQDNRFHEESDEENCSFNENLFNEDSRDLHEKPLNQKDLFQHHEKQIDLLRKDHQNELDRLHRDHEHNLTSFKEETSQMFQFVTKSLNSEHEKMLEFMEKSQLELEKPYIQQNRLVLNMLDGMKNEKIESEKNRKEEIEQILALSNRILKSSKNKEKEWNETFDKTTKLFNGQIQFYQKMTHDFVEKEMQNLQKRLQTDEEQKKLDALEIRKNLDQMNLQTQEKLDRFTLSQEKERKNLLKKIHLLSSQVVSLEKKINNSKKGIAIEKKLEEKLDRPPSPSENFSSTNDEENSPENKKNITEESPDNIILFSMSNNNEIENREKETDKDVLSILNSVF